MLETLKHHIQKTRVLCIGDIILDDFHYGSVSRISPEAPVPVLNSEKSISLVGGVGNVAQNIHALGAEVLCIGVVGDDENAMRLRQIANREVFHFLIDQNRKTTTKLRYIGGSQQILRVDYEDVFTISDDLSSLIIEYVSKYLVNFDVIVLSDYAKGVLSYDLCQRVISLANLHNKLVFIDPKQVNWSMYQNAYCIKPNLKEFQAACRFNDIEFDVDKIKQSALALLKKYNIAKMILTLGGDGMLCLSLHDETVLCEKSSRAVEVYDVSGAGDTVMAVISSLAMSDLGIEEVLQVANAAGSIAVSKIGTTVVTLTEIMDYLNQRGSLLATKVYHRDILCEYISTLRKDSNIRIGLTNGTFDLLHKGHVQNLIACRQECDFLIVCVNTDSSVKRYKDINRPLQSQEDRVFIVSNISSVDAALLFDEDTPFELIKLFKPDIIFKGGDYNENEIVGADFVRSYGGLVKIIKFVDGCSTTNLVNKVLSNYKTT